jgi:nucleotide-binding universal stress UspA family protein
MTPKRRRAYEPGHRPKFLAVVDGTAESALAVRFAARRAARIGSGVLLLAVTEPPETMPWLGVGDAMQAEGEARARALLADASAIVRAVAGLEPETVVRSGETAAEVLAAIAEDEDVALLVLAAGADPSGPGPLVTMLAGRSAGLLPVPLAIVPGRLTDQEIDALA